jgi:hypothetical protein
LQLLQIWAAQPSAQQPPYAATSTCLQGWDQFAINEQQFGVKTTWNEDIYTTKIDRRCVPIKLSACAHAWSTAPASHRSRVMGFYGGSEP